MMQLPLNSEDLRFIETVRQAESAGLWVAVNRPFAMGKLVANATPPATRQVEAFRFVLSKGFRGVILSGTKSAEHLAENLAAFSEAIDPRE
jgi:predicted aldo/keto reductase-like oxidoreductase